MRWIAMSWAVPMMIVALHGCDSGGDEAPGGAGAAAGAGAGAIEDEQLGVSAGDDSGGDASDRSDRELPPLEPGFERYETAPIEVEPGVSNDWAQWVGGPLDQDYDVIAVRGTQWAGGHHALLYATTEAQEPGFTRLSEEADQLTTRLMGGVGGEGGGTVILPEGVVFRAKKGSYLMVQTHYLNATEETITATSVIDVKLEPVDLSRRVASIMSNTDLAVSLASGAETTMDVYCEVQKDLQFLSISNHMHEYGVSTFSEVIEASGERRELKTDSVWSYEWALNPNFDHHPIDDPLFVPAGSTLHTHCVWNNETPTEITFPTEMCVFFGFILNDSDITCVAGSWLEPGANDSK